MLDYEIQILLMDEAVIAIADLPECNKAITCDCKDMMERNFTASNEGYATVLIGPTIAHIINELNSMKKMYSGTVFPVVKEGKSDHRRDKRTDYYIFKIKNKQIRLVIEVKTNVPFKLTGAYSSKKYMAQLFLLTNRSYFRY